MSINLVTRVDQFKYLGWTIDSTFNWNTHITNIVTNASKRLWLLRHRLKHCTSNTKLFAYSSLMRSLLEFGDMVWDPNTKMKSNRIECIHRKALCFICNKYSRNVLITGLYMQSGHYPLKLRSKFHRRNMTFNIVNSHNKLDFQACMEFNRSRPTRTKHSKFILVPQCKTNAYKAFFFKNNRWVERAITWAGKHANVWFFFAGYCFLHVITGYVL